MFAGIEGSISRAYQKERVITISATCKDIWHKTVGLMSQGHQDLMDIATIARSMDIDPLSVDQNLCDRQINIHNYAQLCIPSQLGLEYKAKLSLLSRVCLHIPELL